MKKIFKHVKKFLPFVGLILFIIYIIFYLELTDPTEFNKAKEDMYTIMTSVFLPLAIVLTIPRVLIRNYAWQLVLKEQNIEIGFWQSLKIFLIGYFYGSFTPGYWGQLMRMPYLKEKTGEPYGKLFVNTIIEITIRGVSIYLMIFFGALLFLGEKPEYRSILYIIFAWLIIFFSIILYFIRKERGEKLFRILVKIFIPSKLKSDLNRFVDTFYLEFPRIKKLIIPIVISLFTWVIIFTQEYLLVIPLGLKIDYWVFLLVYPIANVAGFIPITIAGIGTREITAITIFTILYPSVTEIQIFVIAIMGFLVTDALTGFIGFLLSLTETKNKSMKKMFKTS